MALERARQRAPASAAAPPRWTCPRCGRSFAAKGARHSCTSQSPEALFARYPEALPLYEAARDVLLGFDGVEVEATRTQVAFRADRRFAFLWIPEMSLHRGPTDLYLTFDLARRLGSPRIKESVEPRAGLWTHHMRYTSRTDLDAEARGWLREAYETRGIDAKKRAKAAARKPAAPKTKAAAPSPDSWKVPEDDAAVDAYYTRLPLDVRLVARELDALVRKALPKARAGIKWSVPFYAQKGPICYVSAAKAHVTFGLIRGDEVPDASGLLKGTGKSPIRKATFRAGKPVPKTVVAGWLRHAKRLDARWGTD